MRFPFFKKYLDTAVAALIGLWISVLFISEFQRIPGPFGGARPKPVSIIGSTEQIDYLKNFGIKAFPNGEGGEDEVQTHPVCLVYEDDQRVIFYSADIIFSSQEIKTGIGVNARVISLSKSEFRGLQAMKGHESALVCNSSRSFYLGVVYEK